MIQSSRKIDDAQARAALPDDVDALKALVLEQRLALITRDTEIEQLKLLIAKLKRMQFGRSSERLDREVEQLELRLEELQTQAECQVQASTAPSVEEKRRPVRQPLPDHLPRHNVVHTPVCDCPECGQAMRQIGEDIAEVLDYVPASFRVIRHVRPKFACPGCEKIVQVAVPSRPIARGMAGAGLLAHVLVSKYADHQPLYRQSQIYTREGVELERSTLAEWVGQCFHLLDPLVDALGRYVLEATKLHADDTPMPVLEPGRGKTKTGRLWVYVRDDRPAGSVESAAVLFRYSPDRRGERPTQHLKHFSGVLQADAYAGFNELYARGRIREAACWAHYPECGFIQSEASCRQHAHGESEVRTPHKIRWITRTARTRAGRPWASMVSRLPVRCLPSSRMPAWRRASSGDWS